MKSRYAAMMLVIGLALVLAVSPGCKSHKQKPINTSMDTGTSTGMESTTGTEGLPDVEQERLLWSKATGLQPVYFDFDSSSLTPAARETLKSDADKIKQVPGVMIQIEGHCDERGTQEYNLALGERRALAVRQYLMDLGVSGDRLLTISYGEEKPAVDGHTEEAYKMNRRCEFNKAVQ